MVMCALPGRGQAGDHPVECALHCPDPVDGYSTHNPTAHRTALFEHYRTVNVQHVCYRLRGFFPPLFVLFRYWRGCNFRRADRELTA